ncbi:MAG: class I SAM-dependent methyltransferase [Acidobacteriota bacterium]|jgi:ubiquinone/menaquinone biosynthesis C-methylase UbiE|nr:class I SAM-dependent methyltransferase [Acidobacteriota bacterium]
MATDIKKIIGNLLAFYDFPNKTVISVGAGGGQMVEYGRPARRVFAVDNSREALAALQQRLAGSGLEKKFSLVHCDFSSCDLNADVLAFEFCLHEMPDPAAAIAHARKLAGDILVLDHWPGSEWAFCVSEEEKVARSWEALNSIQPRKTVMYETVQFFKDYEELYRKVLPMGDVSIGRIRPFIGRTDFTIPMSYGFALL